MSEFLRKPKIMSVKIGDLLVAADVLSPAELEQAANLANQSVQPLGRVLLDLQFVKETVLFSALKAQTFVGDGTLPMALAIKALGRSARSNTTIEEALDELGWQPPVHRKSDLGDLLVDSDWLHRGHCENALQEAETERMLFGRYLVLKGVVTNTLLNAALEALVYVREESLTREQVIAILKQARILQADFETAAKSLGINQHLLGDRKLALGDILTKGGVITDVDRLEAVERALAEQQMLGSILIGSGLLSQDALDSALSVQSLARSGVMSRNEACDVLRQSQKTKQSVKEVITSRRRPSDSAVQTKLDLLLSGGIVRPEDLPYGDKQAERFGLDILQGLVAAGILSRYIFEALDDCLEKLSAGELTREQAIMALFWCDRSRCTLSEAVAEMTKPSQSQDKQKTLEAEDAKEAQSQSQSLKKTTSWQEIVHEETTSMEFQHGVVVISLYALAGCLTMAFVPMEYRMYAIWALIIIAAGDLLRRGNMIDKKHRAESEEYEARLQSARDVHRRTHQLEVRRRNWSDD
jgi:hypothetical protein